MIAHAADTVDAVSPATSPEGASPTATPTEGTPSEAQFFSRAERFAVVGSTNDVVRDWLATGSPEVCLAIADEQTAGRGRSGRTWRAPDGAALLLSLGFRPTWLPPERTWQLAAVVALAMADAAEEVAVLRDRSIRLKWPNDLVVEDGGPADPRAGALRKLAGVLGETGGLGTSDPRAIVGIGVNAGWRPDAFPADLAPTMTSLAEVSGGRPIDLAFLLDAFTARVEPRVLALRSGRFDAGDWVTRQVTTGRDVRLVGGAVNGTATRAVDGTVDRDEVVRALGVDPRSGALVVADPDAPHGERHVMSGEIVNLRLAGPV
ncbi:MAG: biotin--[acetyl-CoA-carboxylase] ligase [Chloroflexi bacterium]|nr:biotin--[acetyl-CoA-carboxylase] ligase [Chloroflexota bacterium]